MSDKIKTLSQAIRLGATFRPQCRGEFFNYDSELKPVASCALGAAYEAVTGKVVDPACRQAQVVVTGVLMKRLKVSSQWLTQVWHWNDGISEVGPMAVPEHPPMTREQIADKLEAMGM